MNALRSFEVAARHQSFVLAAAELSVSPAAVGFQVKRVEDDLGFPLFVRKHRSLQLTPQGARLMEELTKGFNLIEAAWSSLATQGPESLLKVTAPVAAVKRWLYDEISPQGKTAHGPQVTWDMSQLTRTFDASGPDAALRYALHPPEGLFAEPVLRPWFTPHMRPDVAQKIKAPTDLLKVGLINVDYAQDGQPGLTAWSPWFAAHGLEPPSQYEMNCADTVTAIDMAVETGLVAMGGYFAARQHVMAGRLVAPFAVAVQPASQFWFLCEAGREDEPGLSWLRAAIRDCAKRLQKTAGELEMVDFQTG